MINNFLNQYSSMKNKLIFLGLFFVCLYLVISFIMWSFSWVYRLTPFSILIISNIFLIGSISIFLPDLFIRLVLGSLIFHLSYAILSFMMLDYDVVYNIMPLIQKSISARIFLLLLALVTSLNIYYVFIKKINIE